MNKRFQADKQSSLKQFVILGLILGLLTSGVVFAEPAIDAPESEAGWEEGATTNEVTVFKKDIPGKPAVAVMGRGPVDAPIEKVAHVVSFVDQYPKWIAMMDEARVLRTEADGSRVLYEHFATPFVIANRDMVVRSRPEVNPTTKVFTLKTSSVDNDPAAPPPRSIRTHCFWTHWTLTPIDNGQRTHVEVRALVDPNGSVPKWFVNSVQRSWPRDTIKALRKQAAKVTTEEATLYGQLMAAASASSPTQTKKSSKK